MELTVVSGAADSLDWGRGRHGLRLRILLRVTIVGVRWGSFVGSLTRLILIGVFRVCLVHLGSLTFSCIHFNENDAYVCMHHSQCSQEELTGSGYVRPEVLSQVPSLIPKPYALNPNSYTLNPIP